MRVRNHGKYTKMHKNSPRAIARCDYSGLMVRHSELSRQMQYRGTGLVWTGYMVNPKFKDIPNAQNLTPLIKLDPVPIPDARPDSQIDAQTTVNSVTLDVSSGNITINAEVFFNTTIFYFTGDLSQDTTVFLPSSIQSGPIFTPSTLTNFYVVNQTIANDFVLSIQIINVPQSLIYINNSPIFYNVALYFTLDSTSLWLLQTISLNQLPPAVQKG